PVGEYNTTKIVVNGAHREHWLNGVKVVEYEAWTPDWNQRKATGKWKDTPGYDMAKKGYICLQDHGSGVWFKNIKIRPLSP
ncbi:MAG: 3-keto-disaccharide hydrolase, partial [Flavitalea sp.]